jgi:hypothetical protein
MNTELKSMLHQRFALGILCAALVPACILFGLIGVRLGTNAPNWKAYNGLKIESVFGS